MPNIKDNCTPFIKVEKTINSEGESLFTIVEYSKGVETLDINLVSLELNGNFKIFCTDGFNIPVGSSYSNLIKIKDEYLDCYSIHYTDKLLIIQINTKKLDMKLKPEASKKQDLEMELMALRKTVTSLQETIHLQKQVVEQKRITFFEEIHRNTLVKIIGTIVAILITAIGIITPNNNLDLEPDISTPFQPK